MMEIIKKNLAIFSQGMLFGFGFCIAAWVLYFTFQAQLQASHASRYETSPVTSPPTQNNQFAFRDVEEVQRNGRSYFIGVVKNHGASAARGISIEINLFSKDKFVDQYSSYVTGDLGPGEERYFKVSCGCKDEPPAEHDNYKISVVGGY